MTEALLPVLAQGNEVGLDHTEACQLANNDASRSLLIKLGFGYEGNLRQLVLFSGDFFDRTCFRVTRGDSQHPPVFSPIEQADAAQRSLNRATTDSVGIAVNSFFITHNALSCASLSELPTASSTINGENPR